MTLQELKAKKEVLEKEAKKLKQEIADTEKQIQIEELKPKRWKPDKDEGYYYIHTFGIIYATHWCDNTTDQDLYSIGNYFKTREEAEFALEQLKVLAELKEYADDDKEWDGNGYNRHYSMFYDTLDDSINITWYGFNKYVSFNIYFLSEEQARKAVEAIGKDRLKKYYFCV